MLKRNVILSFLVCFLSATTYAQNTRVNTHGQIGWYNFFGTISIAERWSLHTEYQWRRDEFIRDWQQSLLRTGINFQPKSTVLFRAGYAWIETFAYGEIPINSFGKRFTEHRTFQMLQLRHQEGKVDFSHRFMLEQRFIGRYSDALASREDQFLFSNRMRYLVRAQIPIKIKTEKQKLPYLAFSNEVFIGFGKNVQANVFDQNRTSFLVGYPLTAFLRLEAGYLYQVVQFGRLVNGNTVFQHNQGIIVNINVQFLKRK